MNTDFFDIALALRLARNVRTACQPLGIVVARVAESSCSSISKE